MSVATTNDSHVVSFNGTVPKGVSSGILSRLRAYLPVGQAQPISTQTSGGTEMVYQPPTVVPPPSAANAVMQALDVSVPLQENTVTGAGAGAQRTSLPITAMIPGTEHYLLLAGLAIVLLLAYLWDKGKL